jgi:uncharacterized protein YaaR (DUF327 family)
MAPRIDSLGEAVPYHVPEKKKAQKKEKPGSKSFSHLIESAEPGRDLSEDLDERGRRKTIEELLDGIFESGDALKKLPTMENVKEYRRKVKDFVKFVVSRMLNVRETVSGANIMRRKRFTLVEIIDRQLENLVVSVLSAQREQLTILAQVEEINGMLVDLVS